MALPTIFDPSSVSDVKSFKYGKVFFLTLGDGSHLVLKAEGLNADVQNRVDERKRMDFGFQLARTVASAGDSRVMDQVEVKRLSQLKASFPDKELGWDAALDPKYATKTTWLLMEFAENLKNLDDVLGKGEDKQRLAIFMLMALHQKNNLLGLGRVIAMDCFLGNGDRFALQADSVEATLVNSTNVFFQKQSDKSYKIVGVDPMDPNSGWAKLDQDILVCTQAVSKAAGKNVDAKWPGLKLRSDKEMREVGKRCLRAVNGFLVERAKLDAKTARNWDVRGKHFDVVERGVKNGRDEIKMIAKSRMAVTGGRTRPPTGLQSRMAALGWT